MKQNNIGLVAEIRHQMFRFLHALNLVSLRYRKLPFGAARILAALGFWGSGACLKGWGGLPPFEGATSTPPRWAHNGEAHVCILIDNIFYTVGLVNSILRVPVWCTCHAAFCPTSKARWGNYQKKVCAISMYKAFCHLVINQYFLTLSEYVSCTKPTIISMFSMTGYLFFVFF